ncbi:MAG: hypothetical protein ABL993_05200 [Vicinamibacterales bacterium]
MREVLAKIAADPDALRDLHCYSGIVFLGAGCWLYAPGAGLIAVGVALFYLALRRK